MTNRSQLARTKRFAGFAFLAALILSALMCLISCATGTPPVRTLPTYIKRVYVKEFENRSRLYGAQADLTLYVNDEFMSDGRLDVVQSDRSDVRLEGKIKSYKETVEGSTGDKFPLISTMELVCIVEMWDPYDADRITPVGRWTVPATVTYTSDLRRTNMETVTEAKDRLFRQMAKNIVDAVINRESETPKGLEERGIERYQERRGEAKFAPVITEPRFPKPTPAVN